MISLRTDPTRNSSDGWLYVEHDEGPRWTRISVDWPSGKAPADPGLLALASDVARHAARRALARGHRDGIPYGAGVGWWATTACREDEARIVRAWMDLAGGDDHAALQYVNDMQTRLPRPGELPDGDVTVRDLLDADLCHPACLLARDADSSSCTCRCAGTWHGALIAATVMFVSRAAA